MDKSASFVPTDQRFARVPELLVSEDANAVNVTTLRRAKANYESSDVMESICSAPDRLFVATRLEWIEVRSSATHRTEMTG